MDEPTTETFDRRDRSLERTIDRAIAQRKDNDMTNPIDALPDDPRTDPRLNDVAFISTDEGQALLVAAQQADKEARRVAKNAYEKARRDRAKAERGRIDGAPIGRDPMVIAAEQRAVAAIEAAAGAIGIAAPKVTPPVVAKTSGKPSPKPAAEASVTTVGANRPLKLGDPIDVKGVQYRAILHRDGSIAEHQTDNYIWRCPTCKRRLRDEQCVGPKDGSAHKAVKAPEGYRAADRIVK